MAIIGTMQGLVFLMEWLLLPLLALMGVVLPVALRNGVKLMVGARAQAIGVGLACLSLVLYVASEDDYRDNGTSRWAAYGAQEITVTAVVLGIGAVALLLAASFLRRRELAIMGFLASTAAAVTVFLAIFANSLN
jgi:hypothetical protein